jgi:hypothetical protein
MNTLKPSYSTVVNTKLQNSALELEGAINTLGIEVKRNEKILFFKSKRKVLTNSGETSVLKDHLLRHQRPIVSNLRSRVWSLQLEGKILLLDQPNHYL